MKTWEQKPLRLGVLLMMLFSAGVGQLMSDVCEDVPDDRSHGAQRPRIPDLFHVDVECKLAEQNMTVYVKEYYDLRRNRGRLTVEKPMATNDFFMDYDSNMVLLVNPETSACKTGMLILSGDRFIFGYRMENYNSQIFSPSGALHFGNANETYNGTNVVRGILVDEWHSCQYLAAINATAHVTWYFSRKNTWDMQLGTAVAPVRMMAVGKQVMPNNTVKPFSHTYDFFNFEARVRPGDFEVPDGVVCPGRDILAKSKPFPAFPNNFFFIGEINDPYGNRFSVLQESYDKETKFSMYTFKDTVAQLTGMNQYTELNDFNTGVAYLIDNQAGSCHWSALTGNVMAFTKQVNSQQVRMETPREFFMDSNINYQYAGTATARRIACERWVGSTNQARGFVGTNVSVEWYFATEDHESWNSNLGVPKYRIPVLLRLFLPGAVTSPSYEFHIFDFNSNDPFVSTVDVSECFTGTARRTFRFTFPKSNETVARQNILKTVLAIKKSISLSTGISSLRVADVRLYFNPSNVVVTFDLLDRPPHYDDVQTAGKQNSLDDATHLLEDSFKMHTLTFFFAAGVNVLQLRPDYNSLVDVSVTTPNKGGPGGSDGSDLYSGGAMAGLGIAMLIIGGAGGATGAFFFFK